MREFQLFLRLQEINRPKCPHCDGRMWLTRLEPGEPSYHKRTFECFKCARVTTEIISHNDTALSSACEMLTRGLSERSGVFDPDLFRSLRTLGQIDNLHQR
jgi:hypothetical protein